MIEERKASGDDAGEGDDRQGPVLVYLKHQFSCMPDCVVTLLIDRDQKLVTVTAPAFDSLLFSWLVSQVLPVRHQIVAYRSDDAGWRPPPPPYALRVRVGEGEVGIEFRADAVRLSEAAGGHMAIRLSDPQVRLRE